MIDFDPKYTQERIELTESLLSCIAEHLAKKRSCRHKIYRVAVSVYDNEQGICRNLFYHRKNDCENCIFFDIDAGIVSHSSVGRKYPSPAIQHIIIEHFYDIFAGVANGNQVQIYPYRFIPGIYEYKLSASGKYRKWFKIQ